ncbi:MAG: Asp-tRNA(Asn)/Glu-tRNA(Gln) amidotransferase subunit GatA [Firmicutes bacterium]|nr:Asp-tRNA(Asn)/Glu-tRNA(Gln) amidotransferase subunit GatA [Bacillota bacterium]
MELSTLSLKEIGDALRKKTVSAREITGVFLERINRFNPELNAFVTVAEEEALAAADEADHRLARGERVTPLTGIPVAVADTICTKGLKTTCASRMLANFIPPYDATVVSRLKEAGAVIIAKTNSDEFGAGTTTGYSAFGPVRNPWDKNREPGGDGGAAAVAAGLAPLAVSFDTGGSLRRAAAFCGVAGLKPAYGSVSRYGLAALAPSLEQIGPLARRVDDLALLYQVLAGPDPLDATSLPADGPGRGGEELTGPAASGKGLRIGLPREYFTGDKLQAAVKERVLAAAGIITGEGGEQVDLTLPSTEYALAAHILLAAAEASSSLARYDGVRYGYRSPEAADIDLLYKKTRTEGFGSEAKRRILLGTLVLSAGSYNDYYLNAQKIRTLVIREFAEAFTKCHLILTPVTREVPGRAGEERSPLRQYQDECYTVGANLAGLSGLSVPCGLVDGLPVGVQLLAPAGREALLFQAARTLEAAVGEFSPPILRG